MGSDDIYARIKETAKHGFVFGLGRVLNKAVGFFLIPVYTRKLDPSDYGLLALTYITVTLAGAVFNLGLSTAIFRTYHEYHEPESKRSVISTTLILLLLSSVFLFISGFTFSSFLAQIILGDAAHANLLEFAFAISVINLLNIIPFSLFRLLKRSKAYTIFNLLILLSQTIVVLYTVLVLDWGVWGILFSTMLVRGIGLIVLYLYTIRELAFTFSTAVAKKLLRFGIPWIPSTISVLLLTSIDKYLLKMIISIRDTGIYNLSTQFGMILMLFLIEPFTLIWPTMLFSVQNREDAKEYYSNILTVFTYAGVFLTLGIAILSPNAIILLAHHTFWGAIPIVPLITLGFLVCGISRIVDIGIYIKGRSEFAGLIFTIGAGINVGLNLLLIPRCGMFGAGISFVAAYTIILMLKYIISQRLYYVRYQYYRMGLIWGVGILLFVLSRILPSLPMLVDIPVKAVIILSFPVILYGIRFYYPREIELIKNHFSHNRFISIIKK